MTTPSPPAPLERLRRLLGPPGWPRTVALRRLAATSLVLLAAALALRPVQARGEPDAPMLVAAHDLAPGTTLSAADLRVVHAPSTLAPKGVLTDPRPAEGRVLAGAAAAGEPITAARLVGPENIRLTMGRPDTTDTAAVPVRLADPGVADLLTPGSRVDVVAVDEQGSAGTVVAPDAIVVTVRRSGEDDADRGHLVVLALPAESATQVAATSLHRMITVTLRQVAGSIGHGSG